MNDYDLFFDVFCAALGLVDDRYYITDYNSEDFKMYMAEHFPERKVPIRHSERSFCYELYHQIQILIEQKCEVNKNFLNGLYLQGELKKPQIQEIYQGFGLDKLKKEYLPDFLLHTPGRAEEHAFIIEVKADPRLSFAPFLDDLKKIEEFIIRYQYQRGIMLVINNHNEKIYGFLKHHKTQITNEISRLNRITVVSQLNRHGECCKMTLDSI